MTGPGGTSRTTNPFPVSPVAQLRVVTRRRPAGTAAEEAPVSIETPVWTRLWGQVEEYLEHPEEATTRGRAVALVGELGRGKSHLARQVVTRVRAQDEAVPVWVVDRPGTDLTSLYRDQLTAMFEDRDAREAFERVVETFHAQVTADALAEDTGTGLDDRTRAEFVRQLRRDELDSRKVVRSFEINEDAIHRHLRRELREVVGHKQFATAFALLLDLRFRDLVWAWLAGGVPDRPLVERGITQQIAGVRGVLDALTVFGFLHGQVGKPYVLVVDALDEVGGDAAFLRPFESLVDTYVNRGGLLLLTALPESWSGLPRGLRERVMQIWPPRMSRAEIERLVAAYVHRRPPGLAAPQDGPEQLPFTSAALDQLEEIGDGVPRRVLRICRQAWGLTDERSAADGEPRVIDAAVVHRAVRVLTEPRSPADVSDEVERALAADQWSHEREPLEVSRAADPRLDQVSYWVRVGERDTVAVLVAPSVLDEAEVGDLAAVAVAARAAFDGGCRLLVLVNGTVSRARFNRLAQRIGTAPLLVGDEGFADALRAAVRTLAGRLAAVRQGGDVASMGERLAGLAEEQYAVLGAVRRMETVLRRGATAAEAAEERLLPAAVAERFAAAERAVETLARPPRRVGELFALDDAGHLPGDRRPGRFTFDEAQLTGLGQVSAVAHLLHAFRSGVLGWQRAVARRADGVDAELERSLFVLCRSFEISLEVLPVLGGAHAAGPAAEPEEADRRAEAYELLNRLADEVRTGLLAAGGGVRNGPTPR
ncbi:hypothetical protein [Actinacidiphila yeochonensis]|uniref:hypothetical protein n=1 Tax=Actinacidiphila yeochonensis TaxID=89050 RepID=UPI0005612385|nr:hypothetical protein [Actinacidiphila yeochonensis]